MKTITINVLSEFICGKCPWIKKLSEGQENGLKVISSSDIKNVKVTCYDDYGKQQEISFSGYVFKEIIKRLRSEEFAGQKTDAKKKEMENIFGICDYLVSNGADLGEYINDCLGNTVLLEALVCDKDLARYLIGCAIKYNQKESLSLQDKNVDGNTLLTLAMKHNYRDIVLSLIKVLPKDKLDIGDYQKNTVAHIACLWGDMEIINALYEKGANFNAKNKQFLTPLDYLGIVQESSYKKYPTYGLDRAMKHTYLPYDNTGCVKYLGMVAARVAGGGWSYGLADIACHNGSFLDGFPYWKCDRSNKGEILNLINKDKVKLFFAQYELALAYEQALFYLSSLKREIGEIIGQPLVDLAEMWLPPIFSEKISDDGKKSIEVDLSSLDFFRLSQQECNEKFSYIRYLDRKICDGFDKGFREGFAKCLKGKKCGRYGRRQSLDVLKSPCYLKGKDINENLEPTDVKEIMKVLGKLWENKRKMGENQETKNKDQLQGKKKARLSFFPLVKKKKSIIDEWVDILERILYKDPHDFFTVNPLKDKIDDAKAKLTKSKSGKKIIPSSVSETGENNLELKSLQMISDLLDELQKTYCSKLESSCSVQ